ncbi:MAG: hypothetical protein HXM85_11530 [Neisseria sp.]|nr:hypothetical protein [Neisseria sp.]
MTINQSGIVKEQETTGQVDMDKGQETTGQADMDKGQEATDQADMDKGQETTDQANTCNTRSKKNNRNELTGAFLFPVVGGAIIIVFLVLGYILGNNKFLGSFMPYLFGAALGSLLVLVKELFISRALNPDNDISKYQALFEVFVVVLFCAGVLYFTVATDQKYVHSLTLVVTIFLQNEITVKILK